MKIQHLQNNSTLDPRVFITFQNLLAELRKRPISSDIIELINLELDQINSFAAPEKDLSSTVKRSQTAILRLIYKELKLVPKNYYRNMWLTLGMASFGIPLGVIFGLSFGNMAFLGIGLPFGIAFGIAIGTALDKKAAASGNQLDLEIN